MLRLAALAVALGGLAAAFCLVPLRGRTALDRFQAAPDAGTFFASAWDEWRGRDRPAPARHRAKPPAKHERHDAVARAERAPADRPSPERSPARRPDAARPAPAPHRGSGAAPAEEHSDSDRAALDRLLTDRSR